MRTAGRTLAATNLAPGSQLTCSDKNVPADILAKITDGDKEASEQSII
jgi:hypothetical protein